MLPFKSTRCLLAGHSSACLVKQGSLDLEQNFAFQSSGACLEGR